MLYARKTFDYIPFVNNLYWLPSFLIVASAFQNKQNLTTWMNVPVELCTRIEGCYSKSVIERTIACI